MWRLRPQTFSLHRTLVLVVAGCRSVTNAEGNAVVEKGIEALIAQAKELERAIAVLGLQNIEFEKSNSLDAPEKVGRKK